MSSRIARSLKVVPGAALLAVAAPLLIGAGSVKTQAQYEAEAKAVA